MMPEEEDGQSRADGAGAASIVHLQLMTLLAQLAQRADDLARLLVVRGAAHSNQVVVVWWCSGGWWCDGVRVDVVAA